MLPPIQENKKKATAMSNGDDVLDNWEEIDEAGVSILWHYDGDNNKNSNLKWYPNKSIPI